MANVYIRESQSKTHLTFEVGDRDVMTDMLTQGDEFEVLDDGCEVYIIIPEAVYDQWSRWIQREERINDAYDDAGAETRRAYERAVDEYGYDMERLQDELEAVLGIN